MTALDRIKVAVAAAPQADDALVAVQAGDSAAVASLVTDHDEITAVLLKGARAWHPTASVLQRAGDLRHLLSKLPA